MTVKAVMTATKMRDAVLRSSSSEPGGETYGRSNNMVEDIRLRRYIEMLYPV